MKNFIICTVQTSKGDTPRKLRYEKLVTMSLENLQAREHLWNLSTSKRIILKWIVKKYTTESIRFSGSGQGQVAGYRKHGIETSHFVKYSLPDVGALMYVTLHVVYQNEGLHTYDDPSLWSNNICCDFVTWIWYLPSYNCTIPYVFTLKDVVFLGNAMFEDYCFYNQIICQMHKPNAFVTTSSRQNVNFLRLRRILPLNGPKTESDIIENTVSTVGFVYVMLYI
jgi:hypothetical protein